MAASRSASSRMMLGDLPPSSRLTFFRSSAAACTISLPTSVEPVKATLSTPRMRGQRRAGGFAKAGDDIDHASRAGRLP